MTERSFRQYFGPSPRHDRACVEMRFAFDDRDCLLAPLEPVLERFGLRLAEALPSRPLPLDEAVCTLAAALLARQVPCWSACGNQAGRAWAALAHPFPTVAVSALNGAHNLIAFEDRLPAPAAAQLRRLAKWLAETMKTRVRILSAANLLGLDIAHVNTVTQVYQVGQGAKGLHFDQASNERDTLTGNLLDRNKLATIVTLSRMGLPTTRGEVARTEQQAIAAIERVGLPCVVKPIAMNRGDGVATFLQSQEQAIAAFRYARTLAKQPALIENHVAGDDHRLLVCGDELLWAYRRRPASVTGDGSATIDQLIERENRRRAAIRGGPEAYFYPIAVNEELPRLLAGRYGLSLASVLDKGRRIEVSSQANIARGGELDDETDKVHPDNRALAIRAARLIRTRTMGVDFVTPDISRSWKDLECAIIEVNSAPATSGMGDVTLLLRTLFPNRHAGRIPTVAVIGDADFRTRSAELVAAAFSERGFRLATADYAGNAAAGISVALLPPSVETLMLDPEADAALVLCDPARVERQGLPLRHCGVLIAQQHPLPAWLADAADTVLPGDVTQAKLVKAIAGLAQRFADPAEGGPLPVIEPIEPPSSNAVRFRVWRTHAMPRAWFWNAVGKPAPEPAGMATRDDLLAAVKLLAGTKAEFTVGDSSGPWLHPSTEVSLELPARERDKARAALAAAVERINAICRAKID